MKQHDECREFLESYGELLTEVRRLKETHLALWEQSTSITARYSDMPRGGGVDKEKLLAILSDADERTVAKYTEALHRKAEIEDFIDAVPGSLNRSVLRLRYIERLGWDEVGYKLAMNKVYMGDRQLYRVHGQALTEARKLWEEQHRG